MLRPQDDLLKVQAEKANESTSSADTGEITLIVRDDENELDKVLEFSVTLDDEGSEIEYQSDAEQIDEVLSNVADSDIWKEFRQMSEESQRMLENQLSEANADTHSTAGTLVSQEENTSDEREVGNTSKHPVDDTGSNSEAGFQTKSSETELTQYAFRDGIVEVP